MHTYYRMTGSKQLIALYRCEHCGRVALHPVTMKKQTTYDPAWTKAGTERRRESKQIELSGQMDKAAAAMAQGKASAFLGKKVDGRCPHCSKKQSWMRMSYDMWKQFVGIMALMTALAAFNLYTFEGKWSQRQMLENITAVVAAVLVLAGVGLVIHAALMLLRTRRTMQTDPVYIARTAEELQAAAAQHPAYMEELVRKGA